MGFVRPTQAEREKRITATAELLARGVRQGDIKRVIAQRFDVSPRSVERYLRCARAMLIEESGDSHELAKAKSLDTYRSILRTTDNDAHRLAAQSRIDRILGLEHQFSPATVQHEHNHKVSVELMESIRKEPKLRNRMLAVLDDLPGGFDQ